MPSFDPTGLAVIYGGFEKGSTLVTVRVPGVTPGSSILLFDEDTLTQLGFTIAATDDIGISVAPLTSQRIIAFNGAFGQKTAGGVAVLESFTQLTGWLTPEPVDAESVPEEIGLYNPGSTNPLTARYDPLLVNSIPLAYKAAAIALVSEPIVFDLKITYKVDPGGSHAPMAVVEILTVKNARGAHVSVIDGTTTASKNILVDKTFNVVITDSEGRTATKSVTVTPVTGYMPVPPTPPASIIDMFMMTSYLASGGNVARCEARCASPLEISYNGGSSYENMNQNSTSTWSSLRIGVSPPNLTMVVRVISNPSDSVTRVIPVPYP